MNAKHAGVARERQAAHADDDGLEGVVEEYLAVLITKDWYDRDPEDRREYVRDQTHEMGAKDAVQRTRVCVAEVWVECLGEKPGASTRSWLGASRRRYRL